MEYTEAKAQADKLAKETNKSYAVRLSFYDGNFFVCEAKDPVARCKGSLEYITDMEPWNLTGTSSGRISSLNQNLSNKPKSMPND